MSVDEYKQRLGMLDSYLLLEGLCSCNGRENKGKANLQFLYVVTAVGCRNRFMSTNMAS